MSGDTLAPPAAAAASTAVPAAVPPASVAATAATSGNGTAALPTSTDKGAATDNGATAAGAGKRPATVEGCGDAKRRKVDFSVGDRGVFYTTMTPGKAHDARRDLVRLLEEALLPSTTAPTATPAAAAASTAAAPASASAPAVATATPAGTRSTSAQLEAEMKLLRERRERFITCGQEVAKGTGFVKFAADAAAFVPSEAVVRLLEAQKAEFQATNAAPSSRLLCRVLPIDFTCKPHIEDFQKLAKTVLLPHLGDEAEPTVWALEFRARNTTTLKKEAVLNIIDELWSKDRHKVNLNDPQKCILVEVNPLFCGLSVLPRWAELKKYNLHALTSAEEPETKPKKAVASKPAALPTGDAVASGGAVEAEAQASATAASERPTPAAKEAAAVETTNGGSGSPDASNGGSAEKES